MEKSLLKRFLFYLPLFPSSLFLTFSSFHQLVEVTYPPMDINDLKFEFFFQEKEEGKEREGEIFPPPHLRLHFSPPREEEGFSSCVYR